MQRTQKKIMLSEIGEELKRKREAAKLSQRQVVAEVERQGRVINQSKLSRIEAGNEVSEILKKTIEDAIARLASNTSSSGFDHVSKFLTIVNTPVGHDLLKLLPVKEKLPQGSKGVHWLEDQDAILWCANKLVDGARSKGHKPSKIWIVSGSDSLFAPPSQLITANNVDHVLPIEHQLKLPPEHQLWHRLLEVIRDGWSVRHLFFRSRNSTEIFERLSGIAQVLARTVDVSDEMHASLTRDSYLTTVLDDLQELQPRDLFFVPGQGMIQITLQGNGTYQGMYLADKGTSVQSSPCEPYRELLSRVEEDNPAFVRVCSRKAARNIFQGNSTNPTDWLTVKNGVFSLMINPEATMSRATRIYESMQTKDRSIKDKFLGEMKNVSYSTFMRRQNWRILMEHSQLTSTILSQKALRIFKDTRRLEDGAEYFAHLARSKGATWEASLEFDPKECIDILQGIIKFLLRSNRLSGGRYALYLVSSFEEYGLKELGYNEEAPSTWWDVQGGECYFVLGRKEEIQPQVLLQVSDLQVAGEMKSFFLSLTERIKRGETSEYHQEDQIAWIGELIEELNKEIEEKRLQQKAPQSQHQIHYRDSDSTRVA